MFLPSFTHTELYSLQISSLNTFMKYSFFAIHERWAPLGFVVSSFISAPTSPECHHSYPSLRHQQPSAVKGKKQKSITAESGLKTLWSDFLIKLCVHIWLIQKDYITTRGVSLINDSSIFLLCSMNSCQEIKWVKTGKITYDFCMLLVWYRFQFDVWCFWNFGIYKFFWSMIICKTHSVGCLYNQMPV